MTKQRLKPVLLPFGKTIFQTSFGQPISSDTAELVNIILNKEKNERLKILEFGTGNGIISLMLSHYKPKWEITAFDIQESLIKLAKKNAEQISKNISFFVDDIKNPINIGENIYDLIVGNPPYFPIGESRVSPIYERAVSRNEILCKMNDVLGLIKNKLAKTGKGYLIYPLSRLEEFQKKIEDNRFKIVNLYFQKNKNKRFFIAEITND